MEHVVRRVREAISVLHMEQRVLKSGEAVAVETDSGSALSVCLLSVKADWCYLVDRRVRTVAQIVKISSRV